MSSPIRTKRERLFLSLSFFYGYKKGGGAYTNRERLLKGRIKMTNEWTEAEKEEIWRDIQRSEWEEEMNQLIAEDIAGTEQCSMCRHVHCKFQAYNNGECEDYIHFENRWR